MLKSMLIVSCNKPYMHYRRAAVEIIIVIMAINSYIYYNYASYSVCMQAWGYN